ncbi:hypothetical protein L903_12600 [Agrobacterium sp. JL28]|nr:hypothetical protein L903_12600 [Agrobacterium sp. JL28]KVK41827.1 hypothetical protein L904_11860 [Agrobacterium sp. LY4]
MKNPPEFPAGFLLGSTGLARLSAKGKASLDVILGPVPRI